MTTKADQLRDAVMEAVRDIYMADATEEEMIFIEDNVDTFIASMESLDDDIKNYKSRSIRNEQDEALIDLVKESYFYK